MTKDDAEFGSGAKVEDARSILGEGDEDSKGDAEDDLPIFETLTTNEDGVEVDSPVLAAVTKHDAMDMEVIKSNSESGNLAAEGTAAVESAVAGDAHQHNSGVDAEDDVTLGTTDIEVDATVGQDEENNNKDVEVLDAANAAQVDFGVNAEAGATVTEDHALVATGDQESIREVDVEKHTVDDEKSAEAGSVMDDTAGTLVGIDVKVGGTQDVDAWAYASDNERIRDGDVEASSVDTEISDSDVKASGTDENIAEIYSGFNAQVEADADVDVADESSADADADVNANIVMMSTDTDAILAQGADSSINEVLEASSVENDASAEVQDARVVNDEVDGAVLLDANESNDVDEDANMALVTSDTDVIIQDAESSVGKVDVEGSMEDENSAEVDTSVDAEVDADAGDDTAVGICHETRLPTVLNAQRSPIQDLGDDTTAVVFGCNAQHKMPQSDQENWFLMCDSDASDGWVCFDPMGGVGKCLGDGEACVLKAFA